MVTAVQFAPIFPPKDLEKKVFWRENLEKFAQRFPWQQFLQKILRDTL